MRWLLPNLFYAFTVVVIAFGSIPKGEPQGSEETNSGPLPSAGTGKVSTPFANGASLKPQAMMKAASLQRQGSGPF